MLQAMDGSGEQIGALRWSFPPARPPGLHSSAPEDLLFEADSLKALSSFRHAHAQGPAERLSETRELGPARDLRS